jgi:AmmeMemoRadiSam system protein A
VTFKIDRKLRGCIGYVEARKPIYETIIDNAINAGTRDPRFAPMTPEDLKKAKIEISVMTPLKKVGDVADIEVGKHGLMITKGYHSGLLLPQVATEYQWDKETFLQHTCLKAGLKKDDWKEEDAVIYAFSAQVFHEE